MGIYDVVILGAGPAGMTAAIYAGRYNLKTLVVGKSVGGTANLAGEVENWPGFVGSGMELMKNIRKQAVGFGVDFLNGNIEKVGIRGVGVSGAKREFVVDVDDKVIVGRSLIVALGTEHRQLNIPGEKEFLGKGVSYCATCDGNFFRGKRVAVIGGADAAAKAAIYLSGICKKVYVVYRKHEMRCEPISLSKISSTSNIEIHYYSNPVEIIGETRVTGLRFVKSEVRSRKSEERALDVNGAKFRKSQVASCKLQERVLDVDGVFIEIGAVPAVEVVRDLGLEMDGDYIVCGKDGRTNVDGVFAAGDVSNNFLKQMINAAGEGAVAGKGVFEYLLSKKL